MSGLFAPLTLRGMVARNRAMMSPMSQNSATPDGVATPWHMVHYGSRAVGGCGMILMEDTAVRADGRVSETALCLATPAQAEALAPVVAFCRQAGARVGIQIAHAGPKALRNRRSEPLERLSAGEGPFAEGWAPARALEGAEIEGVVEAFVASARMALAAGFDFLEIHAAHGYLIHQFLSPLTNTRADGYGGTAVGRARLLREIVSAVRAVWPEDRPLFCRMPAEDGHPDGLSQSDILSLARELAPLGIDVIDVAAGNVRADCAVVTGAQMQETARLIHAAGIATTTGGAPDRAGADRLIAEGVVDLVTIGRPLLRNPYWLLEEAGQAERDTLWPSQYGLAMPKG